jgi:uncharacterized protein YegP (UPF0339 family)
MPSFHLRPSGRDWTFLLVDDNGETIIKGGTHSVREFALRTIEAVRFRSNEQSAYISNQTVSGRHAFKLIEADGRTIATSNFYSTASRRDAVLEACRLHACTAPVVDESRALVNGSAAVRPPEPAAASTSHPDQPAPVHASPTFPAPARQPVSPRFVVQTVGSGHRLVLLDDLGHALLSAIPCPVRAHCDDIAAALRSGARDPERFTKHLSDTGAHSFRIRGPLGNVLATSRFYSTAAERDDAIRRCGLLAPLASGPGPEVVTPTPRSAHTTS